MEISLNLNNISKKSFMVIEGILSLSLLISIFFLPFSIAFFIIFLQVNIYLFREKKDNILFMLNSILFGIALTSAYYFEKIGLILMASYVVISFFLTVKSDLWFYDDLKKQKL